MYEFVQFKKDMIKIYQKQSLHYSIRDTIKTLYKFSSTKKNFVI